MKPLVLRVQLITRILGLVISEINYEALIITSEQTK